MRKRLIAFMAWAAVAALGTSIVIATTANIDQDKFFAYGGGYFSIDTELRGIVVRTAVTDLFIAADPGYEDLGLKGNVIRGEPNEKDTTGVACYAGDDILGIIGSNSTAPIIKLETYSVGGRPDSGIVSTPTVVDHGVTRVLEPGDHVKISGLYVIDYSHPPYCNVHMPSWTYMRGLYKAAYAHAELHPYTPSSIELIGPENSASEVHEVAAPIYPQIYSKTWAWNKLVHLDGVMVESEKQASRQASFFLSAPPRPTGNVKLVLQETETLKTGNGIWALDQSTHFNGSEPDGISVTMRATGSDVLNPAIYRARFQAVWGAPSAPDPPAPPSVLTAGNALQQQMLMLSEDHRFRLILQGDSNLVLYDQNNKALWASRTVNANAVEAIMQDDGNFVLYDAWNTALWASHTSKNNGAYLNLQNDGNLVVYGQNGRSLWASNTVVR